MLLSLKDEDDDDDDDELDEEEEVSDNDEQTNANYHHVNKTIEGVKTNDNLDSDIQQTVLAFDEHDFFNTRNLTDPNTLNGHVVVVQQQATNIKPQQPVTTASLLNTLDTSAITISSTTSPLMSNGSGGTSGKSDSEMESSNNIKTSNGSQQQKYYNSNTSPRSGNSHTNSPARQQHQAYTSSSYSVQQSTPRLFSSNVLPAHLRQDSYNSHDDADEICLVPEVDFESSSIMDHCSDNRESQPLLGGGSGGGGGGAAGSAGSRDHFDMACNTFMGKCFFYVVYI